MKDLGRVKFFTADGTKASKEPKVVIPASKARRESFRKNKKDSPVGSGQAGQAGMTASRAFIYLVAGILMALFLLAPSFSVVSSAEDSGFQFSKINELRRIQPKKPVKIKLKRTVKGQYSWELSGDDAAEILKTDRELRKVLRTGDRQEKHGNVRR